MGLLSNNSSLGIPGLSSITKRNIAPPKEFGPDYQGGFNVFEVIDREVKDIGITDENYGFTLIGSFMPVVPFSFGGTQELKKDYYPGNAEPVIQVMGPRENDITIKGRFYVKRLRGVEFRDVPNDFQKQVDDVRRRGNLLKLVLGDWQRYGYLEEASFDLKRRMDMEYTLKFIIIGQTMPKDCKLVGDTNDDLIAANQSLINEATQALANARNYPSEMPRTLSEFLDDQIAVVAGAISLVTNFVDGILNEAEALTRSGNRALGLIKNAQSTISRTGRRIGAIQTNLATLGTGFVTAPAQLKATILNTVHMKKTVRGQSSLLSLQLSLASLADKYRFYINTVPLKRHLTISGDTLQRIAMKYYHNADFWKKIYDHNKLTTTELTVGRILEIPRL